MHYSDVEASGESSNRPSTDQERARYDHGVPHTVVLDADLIKLKASPHAQGELLSGTKLCLPSALPGKRGTFRESVPLDAGQKSERRSGG